MKQQRFSFIDNIPVSTKVNPRKIPIDVIYTLQGADCSCCIAVQAGLKYGIQSASFRLCPYTGQLSGRHKVEFIDNDYFNYNHQKHLEVVRQLSPKYATIRDVMNLEQCENTNIAFYSFQTIMDWAEELSQYAENIIVIPKYDCIDKIPDKFVLGFSIPTKHGGTPLNWELFKGRAVHLLGGSWKEQIRYMYLLADEVVSVDNNYIQLIAKKFGQYVTPNGEVRQLKQTGFEYLGNSRYVALALSFGAMAFKVRQMYNL